MIRIAAAAALLVLAAPASAAGAVHKCKSADGQVHYSQQPCPASAEGEVLRVQPPATPVEPAAEDNRKSLDERIAAATDPVIKAQLQLEKQRCELAMTQLQRYADAPYLVEKHEDGTERQLSEKESEAAREKLRQQIESRCK